MPGLGNKKNSIDISTVKKKQQYPAALLNASSLGSGVNESQKKIQPFMCCCLEEGFSAFPESQGESQKMGFCRMQKAVSHCKPQWCAKAIRSQMKLVFLPVSKLSADTWLEARMIPNRDLIFTISESTIRNWKTFFIIIFFYFKHSVKLSVTPIQCSSENCSYRIDSDFNRTCCSYRRFVTIDHKVTESAQRRPWSGKDDDMHEVTSEDLIIPSCF